MQIKCFSFKTGDEVYIPWFKCDFFRTFEPKKVKVEYAILKKDKISYSVNIDDDCSLVFPSSQVFKSEKSSLRCCKKLQKKELLQDYCEIVDGIEKTIITCREIIDMHEKITKDAQRELNKAIRKKREIDKIINS